jgi:4-amino-4-deoxy-L-arabinose transferase-like glycosyltransferase
VPETSYASSRDHAAHAARSARPPLALRLLRGPDTDPAWYRPALLGLLVCTAVLYLWNLSASGYANSFYAAAVQSGTESWKAFFFGSLDASSFITVDKPPASLWVMELSGRIFGFSSWSMLVPDALEGVAAVALLAATVRRAVRPATSPAKGAIAGLIAGAVLAVTPAAVLIFRFNNPDAFLVLLLVFAAYCVTRAAEKASTRWLLAAGVTMGLGFLTKSGEALLPLPAFALAYLVAAPATFWRRIRQLLAAGIALVVAAGWWVAAVLLTPAADRPYIGGSTDNNPLQLAFGYNGLDRLFGNSAGGGGGTPGGTVGRALRGTAELGKRALGGTTSGTGGLGGTAARTGGSGAGAGGFGGAGGGPGGGGAGSSFGGSAGIQRLFGDEFGREISWLLPAAAILLIAGVWLTWRRKRTDQARAGLIIWGGWLLIVGVTFAYMQGTIHPYYTVALAPAIGALIGIGGVLAWHRARQPRTGDEPASVTAPAQEPWPAQEARAGLWQVQTAAVPARPRTHRGRSATVAYAFLALALLVNVGWDVKLWRDNSSFRGSLAYVALAVGVAAMVALGVVAWRSRAGRRLVAVTATLTGLALITPAAAWAVGTAATPHTGSIPDVVSVAGSGGFGGGGTGGTGGGFGGGAGFGDGTFHRGATGQTGTSGGTAPTGGTAPAGGTGTGGATRGDGTAPAGSGAPGDTAERGTAPGGTGETGTGAAGTGGTGTSGGTPGGDVSASSALVTALRATSTRWAAAVEGSQDAASLELSSGGKAVMAMGGFTGSDPAPTLAEFEAWAKAGDITYYIAGGGMGGGPGGGSGSSSQITSWVEAHYKSQTIGGETVYNLLAPK